MSSILFAGLVLVAALACPAHMLWQHRRGKQAACCPPARTDAPDDLDALRSRQTELRAEIERRAEQQAGNPAAKTPAAS